MSADKPAAPSRPAAHAPPGTGAGEPRLAAQWVRVRDLTVACRVGVTEEERAHRQRLRLDIELEVRPRAPRRDQIGEVVDYGAVVDRIRSACEAAECRLLETLAGQVAAACFFDPRVLAARVRIEKLDRYADVSGIGCELDFRRAGA